METRIAELRYKEVISVTDGSRFGYVGDMEVDLESGQVRALVVPGRLRLFGLLGREEDRYIPWDLSLIHICSSRDRPVRLTTPYSVATYWIMVRGAETTLPAGMQGTDVYKRQIQGSSLERYQEALEDFCRAMKIPALLVTETQEGTVNASARLSPGQVPEQMCIRDRSRMTQL